MSAHVLPLFSSQKMTDSEITLTKKLSKLTRESATRKLSTVNVLGYNKLNLYFVLSTMIVILKSLDSLFGLKESFSDLHKWFQRCVMIGGSRTRPPRIARDGLPEGGPYCHRRHEGGLEGMGLLEFFETVVSSRHYVIHLTRRRFFCCIFSILWYPILFLRSL